jgi:V8-like Glu-specific endopeptidase
MPASGPRQPNGSAAGSRSLFSAGMQRHSHRAQLRLAGPLAALLALLATAFVPPAAATASPAHAAASSGPAAVTDARQAARVARFWTPARMRAARPLDLVVGAAGKPRLRVGAPASEPTASASFRVVSTPDVPPFSYNGRVFIRREGLTGYCSGTAINSPTRQLVLTAGHCLNSGHEDGKRSVWSNYLQFVPAYHGGVAPFGSFVARRNQVRTPRQWTKHGNPDFDLGAFLTLPNAEGANVADAVGRGATILIDLSRRQTFQTFGYPGQSKFMQSCSSPYTGDDRLSNRFPGPPTLGIRCQWAPGASGGGWLVPMVGDDYGINGISTYLHLNNRSHTYSPYFSRETVGKLVRGF